MLVKILKEDEMKDGEIKRVETQGLKLAVFKVKGEFYAIDELCTHAEGHLDQGYLEDDYIIVCPVHGGKFDIRTGKVLGLPPTEDTNSYKVIKKEGEVFLDLKEAEEHDCKHCENCTCEDKKDK